MAYATPSAAQTSFEVVVDLSGSVQPGYAGDYYCPPEGAECTDWTVDGLTAENRVRKWNRATKAFEWETRTLDLLKGLDDAARKTLLGNIAELIRDEAEDVLIAEAA